VEPIVVVLAGWGIEGDEGVHLVRVIRSALHGFICTENGGGFGLPSTSTTPSTSSSTLWSPRSPPPPIPPETTVLMGLKPAYISGFRPINIGGPAEHAPGSDGGQAVKAS
jgi:hypothetical protein